MTRLASYQGAEARELDFISKPSRRRGGTSQSNSRDAKIQSHLWVRTPNLGATEKENEMTIETNKARAAETSPHHVVLKMLIVSTFATAAALALAAALN